MPNLGNNMASPASNISRRHSALRWSLALLLIFPSHVASAAFVSQGRQQPHHSIPHRSMYRSNVIVPERSMIASAKSEVRGALWTPNGAAVSPPLLHVAALSENNNAEHGGKMGKRRRLRAALSGLLGRPGRRRRLRQAIVSSAAGLALGLVMMNPRSVDAAAAAAARASAVAAPSAKTQGPGSGDGRSSPTKIIVVGAAAAVGTAYGRGVILTKDDDADDGESRKRKRDVFNKIMGITKKEDGGSETTTTTTKNANDLKIEKDLKRQAFELNKELNNEAEEMREERIQMELKAAEKKMGLDGTKTKAMPASSTSSGVDMADKKGAADSIGATEREASLRKVQEEEDLQKKKEAFDKAREEEERKIRAKADKLERERLEIERKAAERAAAEKRAAEEARLAAEKAEQARIAEAERALERQRHEEARRAAEQKATEEARAAEEKRKAERAAAEKLLEEKKAEAEKKWIEERMNVEEAKVAVKQMNQQQQQQQSRSSTSYVQKPRNAKEDKRMSENYASMDLEERAFNILLDLGMISQSPDPSDPSYDPSSDHLFAPENIFKE